MDIWHAVRAVLRQPDIQGHSIRREISHDIPGYPAEDPGRAEAEPGLNESGGKGHAVRGTALLHRRGVRLCVDSAHDRGGRGGHSVGGIRCAEAGVLHVTAEAAPASRHDDSCRSGVQVLQRSGRETGAEVDGRPSPGVRISSGPRSEKAVPPLLSHPRDATGSAACGTQAQKE